MEFLLIVYLTVISPEEGEGEYRVEDALLYKIKMY